MTALGINNPNSKWAREYNARNGGISIARPFNMRDELNKAYTAAMVKARSTKGSSDKVSRATYRRAVASMADLSEQLTLLDAIEGGYIKPVFGGAVKLAGLK
jgi:hypothetical protein